MIGQSLRFAPYTIATASLLYLLVLITLYTLQRQVQYQPSHRNPSPAAVGLTGVQVITLPTPDGADLVLWYAPPAPDRPTLLFFHGNAGEIADRADRFAYYQRHDFGVAFLSYRGFGGSTGTISETGLLTDARTAYDGLTAQGTPPDRIGLVGESLGTGVAVQLVARVPIGAVALGAPYTSTADVAAWRFPWLPVRWLMKDQFRSIDYIAAINAPLLIQHGDADQVIPFRFGAALFQAAPEPKSFLRLPSRCHDALFTATIWQEEVAFFDQVFADIPSL